MPRSKSKGTSKTTSPSATPLPRTIVYIDSFNLYYGCLKHTPYRWLNIEQMCALLLPDHHILAIKYYTARIKPPADDPDKAVRQEVYLRALATLPLVTMTFGQYLSHVIKRPLEDPALIPIVRFVSVMVLLPSWGHSECRRLSSAGDVQRQCRGADTPASAPVPPHRPRQSSGATHRAPGAPAPRRA